MSYAFPVKRSSRFYDMVRICETDFFFRRKKAVRYGKADLGGGRFLYRFANDEAALTEDRHALEALAAEEITREEYLESRPPMGNMVVVSDLGRGPEEIYGLYKCRDRIEKLFRKLFSILGRRRDVHAGRVPHGQPRVRLVPVSEDHDVAGVEAAGGGSAAGNVRRGRNPRAFQGVHADVGGRDGGLRGPGRPREARRKAGAQYIPYFAELTLQIFMNRNILSLLRLT